MSDLDALIALIDHNQVYADLEEIDREAYLQARAMLLDQADRIAALTAERDALAEKLAQRDAALKAADELAIRARAVFQSEYHNTSHIEGARTYYNWNMDTLAAYRKARSQANDQ